MDATHDGSTPKGFGWSPNPRRGVGARVIALGIFLALVALPCRGQVPANYLPAVSPSGEYARTLPEEVKVVTLSQSGLILECTQNGQAGAQPFTWREHYTVREGRLVLDGVLTPQMVPPQPAHIEWQVSEKIGTANIGPTTIDPHWKNYGGYLQRVIEIAQREWEDRLAEAHIYPKMGKAVSVSFVMDSKGAIARVTNVHPSPGTPDEAAAACVRAITAQAPYGNWTEDMVTALGREQNLTFSFYYE